MDNLFKERKNRLDVFRKWRKKPIPKAKEIPDHVFMSCSHCHASVAMMDLVSNHYVCPKCHHPFKISARERIRQLMNPTRTGGRIRKILIGMESAFRYLMKTEHRKSGQETENNGNGF